MSRLVPAVAITLDKERALKCNFNALALIKEWNGLNAFKGENVFKAEIFTYDGKKAIAVDPSCLRGVLAALLFEDDELMTPQRAGKLIDAENYGDVLAKCVQSVNSFFPEKEAAKETASEETDPNVPKPASTSPTSGLSDATTSDSQSLNSGA
jgi:hypothetical protein